MIRREFPHVIVTALPDNRGVSGGNNAGICVARQAGARYVLLINNDTVLDPGILRAFVDAAKAHPQAGVFGAKLLYHARPDLIWSAGCFVDGAGRAQIPAREAAADDPRWNVERECDWVCGCGLFASLDAFSRAGLFDERFFLIWQEIDWCYPRPSGRLRDPLCAASQALAQSLTVVCRGRRCGPTEPTSSGAIACCSFRGNVPFRKSLTMWRWGLWPDLRRELCLFLSRHTDPARRRVSRAALRGVTDYYLGRFGNGPRWLFDRPANGIPIAAPAVDESRK